MESDIEESLKKKQRKNAFLGDNSARKASFFFFHRLIFNFFLEFYLFICLYVVLILTYYIPVIGVISDEIPNES